MGARHDSSVFSHWVTRRAASRRRRPRARRPLLWLLLSALLLVSCTRTSQERTPSPEAQAPTTPVATVHERPTAHASPTLAPAATPTPLPAGPPDETLLAVGDLMDDEGRLPEQAALEIFAAYVAPLPGVTPRPLPGNNPSAAVKVATRVLLGRLDRLPPEIATTVEEALFGGIDEWLEIPPSGSQSTMDRLMGLLAWALSPPQVRAQDESAELERLGAFVEEMRGRIEARSGRPLRLPMRVGLNPRLPADVGAEAQGTTVGGRVAACQIVFNPAFLSDPSVVEFVAAHEVWHCFQFDYAGWPIDERSWLVEGQAAWVGAEVATPDPTFTAGWWNTWLGTPERSLWRRSYDAIGLYAAAQAAGHDPFDAMLDMFRLGNREAVSRLFGGRAYEEALWIVGTSLVRSPEFGPEWEASGRGITMARATSTLNLDALTLLVESSKDAGPFGSLPKEISIDPGDREFVRIVPIGEAFVGVVEFPGHGPLDVPPGTGIWFCLTEGQCTCPDGSGPHGGPVPPLLEESRGVATVITTDGGSIGLRLEAFDQEDACKRLVGTWVASVMDILAANLAPYGGVPPGLSCSGENVLTFGTDGSFGFRGGGMCQMLGSDLGPAPFRYEGTGTYEDLGDSFVIRDAQVVMQSVIEGVPWGFTHYEAGKRIAYTIEGNLLTIQSTTPDGNTIVHTYTRVD